MVCNHDTASHTVLTGSQRNLGSHHHHILITAKETLKGELNKYGIPEAKMSVKDLLIMLKDEVDTGYQNFIMDILNVMH